MNGQAGRISRLAKFIDYGQNKVSVWVAMYYAKHARGTMARWIMENRVNRADGLKDFYAGGYSLIRRLATLGVA